MDKSQSVAYAHSIAISDLNQIYTIKTQTLMC